MSLLNHPLKRLERFQVESRQQKSAIKYFLKQFKKKKKKKKEKKDLTYHSSLQMA